MALLSDRDERDVRAQLAGLGGPVTLVNFTQELACQYCRETEQLLKEVAALSDKIRLEIYNFQLDKTQVAQYRVDKIPATVVAGAKDYRHPILRDSPGVRVRRVPGGHQGRLARRDGPQAREPGGLGRDRPARAPSGVLHPDLTALSGRGAAGPAAGGGERFDHGRSGRGHGVPASRPAVSGAGGAPHGGERDGQHRGGATGVRVRESCRRRGAKELSGFGPYGTSRGTAGQ